MLVIKHIHDLKNHLKSYKNIGFVPTMGALHQGHISLICEAKKNNELTVCSIFVNPTQFNDPADFKKYPITIESDIELLLEAHCDVLFLPEIQDMYPDGMENLPNYAIGYLDTILDGKFRKGHFNGVCIIVHRLLLAVEPQTLYLGEKDFQQCLVIRQMIAQEQLPVDVVSCPTLRMENGLAMSSRNQRLSQDGRKKAGLLYAQLQYINEEQHHDTFAHLQEKAIKTLQENGFETEYLLLAHADTLEILDNFNFSANMVLLVASYFEGVRLIDNLRLTKQ
ncbi:MAG: pantoate--beta-alanine ligase [Chitinophagaceae bacterium]